MLKTIPLQVLAVLTALSGTATATVLGDLAASMKAGEWRQLTGAADSASIDQGGNIVVYADGAVWDPNNEQLLYMGSYHAQPLHFVSYQARTHAWRTLPVPFTYITYHSYDHEFIIPSQGMFYYREQSTTKIHRYDISTNQWGQLSTAGITGGGCCEALAYFPELGGIVWLNAGNVRLFRESTQQWSTLATNVISMTTWQFMEYNPVHKVVVMGSSNGQFRRLSSTGQVTPLKNIPITIYNGDGFTGHLTVDPVSGDYLALTPGNTQLHKYDVLTDTWTNLNNPPPAAMQGTGVVVAPVEDYGVNLFFGCNKWSFYCMAALFVYKHSNGIGIEAGAALDRGGFLDVSPNPFSGGRLTVRSSSDRGEIRIFNLNGKEAARFRAGRCSAWDGRLAPGVYLIRHLENGAMLSSKKLIVL